MEVPPTGTEAGSAANLMAEPTTVGQPGLSEEVRAGIDAGNIMMETGKEELMPLSKRSAKVLDDHNELLEGLMRKKRARLLNVPTDNNAVKRRLREVNQPVTYFGEGPVERRSRLRHILAALDKEGTLENFTSVVADEEETKKDEAAPSKVWYHKGPAELVDARKAIAASSLKAAKERLSREYQDDTMEPVKRAIETEKLNAKYKTLKTYSNNASFIGDKRPVSYCRFSPDGSLIATASWSGDCKLWLASDYKLQKTFPGKEQWSSCIEFHPEATKSLSPDVANLASSGVDGQVHLWSLSSETEVAALNEPVGCRISRLRFHPHLGRHLAGGCWDGTWRMWDIETKQELLYQEGHSKPVYEVDFHPDGSLCASAGLEGVARLWDIRTGRCIHVCQGHSGQVLSVAWSPNGYLLATCGDDNTVKMWDIRKRKEAYTIIGHKSLVSSARFDKERGNVLMTSCYDSTAVIWAIPSMVPINTFKGHEGKVMCCDINPSGDQMMTASYDTTVKLWSRSDI